MAQGEPGRRRRPAFPGFEAISSRRRQLVQDLVAARQGLGLSQTEVAARMGTSQSAVARLEAGEADMRLSTLERYAAAVGQDVSWRLHRKRGQGVVGDWPADVPPGPAPEIVPPGWPHPSQPPPPLVPSVAWERGGGMEDLADHLL